ncbi:uracil-DNA glycosylase family protein [Ferruginibacter albus]|uniref:uracil-DNA glycosylase family protein n=1 Tax=Ferruginibacter albus TaxID=2875540 RepID=UPI001CC6B7AE|nr:uracil-DNA glycosylase family protein [Ferruginibacter albus]UAY50871.1 uracil-DNA glycosylase family protein [Ferruginibacter albus]
MCEKHIEVNPIISASKKSKIIIIGQAPGRLVHKTGIPWNDKSGDNLRKWLGVDKDSFYNADLFALIPMGFCYPGKGRSGDLPPRPECAPLWHNKLFSFIKDAQLVLLVGQYAQNYYLKDRAKPTLTETVRNFKTYLPYYLPLPHPSPRNNIWQAKNKWFEKELLPTLQKEVKAIVSKTAI